MKTAISWLFAILGGFILAGGAAAQNLVITNARVIVGDGEVIDSGSIVIERGRIASVSAGAVTSSESLVIDAGGLTAMPGFVDAHRRVIRGDPDEWLMEAPERMREYAEAGFTTVSSLGDPLEQVSELRERLDAREMPGPRLVVSGPIQLTADDGSAYSEGEIRDTVRDLTLTGADAIHSVVRATPAEIEALSVAKDEADQNGLLTITHIETVADALAAVQGGSGYLSHTPWAGELDETTARELIDGGRNNAEYGLVVTSTLGAPAGADGGSAGPANARQLWDAGVIYAFGTGTELPPAEALRRELDFLEPVFSNAEIIDILTRSAAYAVRRDDALGMLESGKIGDVVLLDGDPLADLDDLFNVRLVVRTGRIIVDER